MSKWLRLARDSAEMKQNCSINTFICLPGLFYDKFSFKLTEKHKIQILSPIKNPEHFKRFPPINPCVEAPINHWPGPPLSTWPIWNSIRDPQNSTAYCKIDNMQDVTEVNMTLLLQAGT